MMVVCRGKFTTAIALLITFASRSTLAFSVLPPTVGPNVARNNKAAASSSTRLHLFNVFNEGKKALVRQLAGDYDQAAIRARLEGLIADSPVLFLSFET